MLHWAKEIITSACKQIIAALAFKKFTLNCLLPWIILFPNWTESNCSRVLNNDFYPQNPSLQIYLIALALTLALEALVLIPALHVSLKKRVAASLIANLCTHPAAVFLWIPFAAYKLNLPIRETILYAELTIPLIEAFIYFRLGTGRFRQVFIYSYIANFASWTVVAMLRF